MCENIARGKDIWIVQSGHDQTDVGQVRRRGEDERWNMKEPDTAARRPNV